MRGLTARIKRFYSMQFDGQVSILYSQKYENFLFESENGQLVSQARVEAENRRCDSYNKVLIISILIFNAIIVAFITFLFLFPFQKYDL